MQILHLVQYCSAVVSIEAQGVQQFTVRTVASSHDSVLPGFNHVCIFRLQQKCWITSEDSL